MSTPDVYDVFLCHNRRDRVAVRTLNEILRHEFAQETFFDESTLVGGDEWEQSIQSALGQSKSLALIIGPNGWGPYQLTGEAIPAVRRCSENPQFRVVPLFLPETTLETFGSLELGSFIDKTQWIDFKDGIDDRIAVRALVAALKGEAAYPEGPPLLTPNRVRFDAIRWDASGRHDDSILYAGAQLRAAVALGFQGSSNVTDRVGSFLTAGKRRENVLIGRSFGAHAASLFVTRYAELACNLALEGNLRSPTPDSNEVLRRATATMPRRVGSMPHPAPVSAAQLSPSGDRIATGCSDGTVALWDSKARTRVALGQQESGIRALAFDPQGEWLASGGVHGDIVIWDAKSGREQHRMAHGSDLLKLETGVGADGRWLLASSANGTSGGGIRGDVSVWNAVGWERVAVPDVMDVALVAHAGVLLFAKGENVAVIRLSDASQSVLPLDAPVSGIAAHPVRNSFVVSTLAEQVFWVDIDDGAKPHCKGASRNHPLRFSPCGKWLALGLRDKQARIYNVEDDTGFLVPLDGLIGSDFLFSRGTRFVCIVQPERKIADVFDMNSKKIRCKVDIDGPVVCFGAGERDLYIARDKDLVNLELPLGDEAQWTRGPLRTSSLAYSEDGKKVIWTGNHVRAGGVVRTKEIATIEFDTSSGDTLSERASTGPAASEVAGNAERLLAHPTVAAACAKRGRRHSLASADSRWLAIHHEYQLVAVFDMSSGTQAFAFSVPADVASMAFSKSGDLLAVGDDHGGIAVWNTDGWPLATFRHFEPVTHLAFSPDGGYLAAASVDLCVRVWVVSTEALAARVRPLLSRGLSAEEWERYWGDEPPSVAL